MTKDTQARAWVFTINNYNSDHTTLLQEWFKQPRGGPQYIVLGYEVAETGTPHIQGYLYRKSPMKWSQIMKHMPKAYLTPARGSTPANIEYCTKDGNSIALGVPPKQGQRVDLTDICELVQQGASMRDIIPQATSIQSIRMAEISLKYFEPKRDWMTELYWYYGPTGTGKTHTALQKTIDPYLCMSTSKWMDGYDGHEDVIIDDYRASFCQFSELLRMINQAPMTVETKGGTRQFRAKRVFITTPYSVERTWATRTSEEINQLTRRITQEKKFSLAYSPKLKSQGIANALQKIHHQENIQEEKLC